MAATASIAVYNNFLACCLDCMRCSTDASANIVRHLHLLPHPSVGTARSIALSGLYARRNVSHLRLLVLFDIFSPFSELA